MTEPLSDEQIKQLREHPARLTTIPELSWVCDELLRLRAELEMVRRDDALKFLEREGYYRCNAAACNCGLWHGGTANEQIKVSEAEVDRLRAEREALMNDLAFVQNERDKLAAGVKRAEELVDEWGKQADLTTSNHAARVALHKATGGREILKGFE